MIGIRVHGWPLRSVSDFRVGHKDSNRDQGWLVKLLEYDIDNLRFKDYYQDPRLNFEIIN